MQALFSAVQLYLFLLCILYLLIAADNTKYKGTRPACMYAGPAASGPSMNDHNRQHNQLQPGPAAVFIDKKELFNMSFVQ